MFNHRLQFFQLVIGDIDVNIIVPRNEIPVPIGAEQRAVDSPILDVMLSAKGIELSEQLRLVVLEQLMDS